jgi:tRNA(Arg) A34 adenosine deaminase TadA
MLKDDYQFMKVAIDEAKKSLTSGGIPIGAVMVEDDMIVGQGHNRLLQENSTILHAEMDCIENAGRLRGSDYKKCTLYTTLSPCEMCSGTIMLYKISRVVIGQNETLKGPEESLIKAGVEVVNLDLPECKEILEDYIKKNPDLWDDEIERIHE